jgi:hypothetical protein
MPDRGYYCLEWARLVSYIQRRKFSGNIPDLPNRPANIPNRMAVPKTKTAKHPIHSAVNKSHPTIRLLPMFPAFKNDDLFVSQSNHGVDPHGAPRGDVTRCDGHNHQKHGDASKGQWVMRTDAEELVGHETS